MTPSCGEECAKSKNTQGKHDTGFSEDKFDETLRRVDNCLLEDLRTLA